jgi:hypothetical protein
MFRVRGTGAIEIQKIIPRGAFGSCPARFNGWQLHTEDKGQKTETENAISHPILLPTVAKPPSGAPASCRLRRVFTGKTTYASYDTRYRRGGNPPPVIGNDCVYVIVHHRLIVHDNAFVNCRYFDNDRFHRAADFGRWRAYIRVRAAGCRPYDG